MNKKGKIFLIICMIIVMLFATSCNMQIIDTTYKFDYVYINLDDKKMVEGVVSSWKDYDDCDMIQVVVNGDTYYTHSSNVILIQRGGK